MTRETKGGFSADKWQAIYSRQMQAIGMPPYEADCWALNAWEASEDDADPHETVSADISYMMEDGE